MADGGVVMDGNLEDGEVSGSGSDSEMRTTTLAPSRPSLPSAFSGHSFQNRAANLQPAIAYRTSSRESSDSDADSSDDDNGGWRGKRQKVCNKSVPRPEPNNVSGACAVSSRKVNNIWGSVVQEQCQDAIAAELGVFGMDGEINMSDRSVETYNYVLAQKIMEKERQQEQKDKCEGLDAQLDQYMSGQERDAKRKRPVKDRLGPRAEMDIKGRYEITKDDPEGKIVEEIVYRLREPKTDLIERVVRIIGPRIAIELLGETATLEESGGIYTMDGSRRRTPGGVYLNLLKNTPSITRAQIRDIFFQESQKEQKSKKSAQKRRRHLVAKKMKQAIGKLDLQEHDDVSRETFASDTNEALEALEEAGREEEEKCQEEQPVGAEETPVVYNSADLEVF